MTKEYTENILKDIINRVAAAHGEAAATDFTRKLIEYAETIKAAYNDK